LALNGFGVPLVEGGIPAFRKDLKGPFKKGLYCCINYISTGIKYCDRRWLVFGESPSILLLLFGEAWAVKHQEEKIILDFVISTLSKIKASNIPTYLVNIEELRKKLGLKANRHKNQVISSEEQKFIEEDYSETIDKIKGFKYYEYKSIEDLVAHMRDAQKMCKEAKIYSDLCKEIVGDRLDLVFKGDKRKKQNQPIEKLIQQKKDTVEYVKVFNPCRAAGIKTAFRVGSLPSNEEEKRKVKVAISEWKASFKGVGKLQARLPTVEAWYVEVLSL
jgi:hypothetical protein